MSVINRWVLNADTNGVDPRGLRNEDAPLVLRKISDLTGRAAQGACKSNLKIAHDVVYATDTVAGTQPANNDTITLGNVVITFVTGSPTGNQVQIGANIAATLAALVAFINSDADLTGIMTAAIVAGSGTLPAGGVDLGAATNFAVLASSTVTAAGTATVVGDLGLYPGTSVTGFPPSTVSGTQHITDAAAAAAQVSAQAAYTDMAGRVATPLVGTLNANSPVSAGVYSFGGSITGNVVLTGSATDVFIFKMASTLITASATVVSLSGGALAKNVFWQVGSSATLGSTSTIVGTIIAQASITSGTGATSGDLMALTGAVTFSGTGNTASIANGSSGAPTGSTLVLTAAVPGTIGNGLQASASALTVGTFAGGSEGHSGSFSLGL